VCRYYIYDKLIFKPTASGVRTHTTKYYWGAASLWHLFVQHRCPDIRPRAVYLSTVMTKFILLITEVIILFTPWSVYYSKMAVLWIVAPCILVEAYQCFTNICCLHHQGDESDGGGRKYLWNQATWRYNPKDSHLRIRRRENLKSYLVYH
jgi:hypothetical protein